MKIAWTIILCAAISCGVIAALVGQKPQLNANRPVSQVQAQYYRLKLVKIMDEQGFGEPVHSVLHDMLLIHICVERHRIVGEGWVRCAAA